MKHVTAIPLIPENDEEVRQLFGDIRSYIRKDGTLSPAWESKFIARVKLPGPVPYAYSEQKITVVTCHVALVDITRALYGNLWDRGLVDALGPYGGGFVFRANRNNPNDLSLHSYGLAWDWNPLVFPNGSTKKRDPRLVAEFLRLGFLCGQEFKGKKDPMHFQFARNT